MENKFIKLCGCAYCDNAIINPELDSDIDLQYMSVGNIAKSYNLSFRTGDLRPTVLMLQHWDSQRQRNVFLGQYVMRYCPECGRELIENRGIKR